MIQLSKIGYQVANPLPSYHWNDPIQRSFLRALGLFMAYRIPMGWFTTYYVPSAIQEIKTIQNM